VLLIPKPNTNTTNRKQEVHLVKWQLQQMEEVTEITPNNEKLNKRVSATIIPCQP